MSFLEVSTDGDPLEYFTDAYLFDISTSLYDYGTMTNDNLPAIPEEKEDRYFHIVEDGKLLKIDILSGDIVSRAPDYEKGLIRGQHFDPIFVKGRGKTWFYNEVYRDLILHHLSSGKTLTEIANTPGFPSLAIMGKWMEEHEDFSAAIRAGKRMRAEGFVDRIIDDIEEEYTKEEVPGAKLRFDKLKYLAKVGNPDEYGDKVKHSGDMNSPLQIVVNTGIDKRTPVEEPGRTFEITKEHTDE